jgi:phospholipid:diacylglycerol acyltransferase
MAALLSGEMRDTVEINQAAVYLLERVFSRMERAKLFRSWAGAVSRFLFFAFFSLSSRDGTDPPSVFQASMMLKGGNDIWGSHEGAPDDLDNSTLSSGVI